MMNTISRSDQKPKIVFAGVAQDCQPYLPKVLLNIEAMSTLASEVAYVFLENDSSDDTKDIINNWGKNKTDFKLINMDGLNKLPIRTLRLEFVRNAIVEYIRSDSRMGSYDYLFFLDMDNSNIFQMELDRIVSSLKFLSESDNRAAVFSNQIGFYYDIWALRHPEICPKDVWEEMLDYVLTNKVSDEEAYSRTVAKRITEFDPASKEFEVDSAFGGFGIYKMKYVINNPNPYLGSKVKVIQNDKGSKKIIRLQVCEHVHFNLGIKLLGGKLFIIPSLINGINTENLSFMPSFYRSLSF